MIQVISASIGENGSIHGGAPGDQTGAEVWVRNWYNKPWNLMLRYPDINVARAAATAGYLIANSNLAGYNQDERNTLYQALKRHNFNVPAYIASGEKTNCDCSSFVFACYAVALPAIRYDGDAPSTSEMRAAYTSWGFTAYTQSMYLTSPDHLLIGDILVSEGRHTVIAWEEGAAPVYNDEIIIKKNYAGAGAASGFDGQLAGLYRVIAPLYIRSGASLEAAKMAIMPADEIVYCNGLFGSEAARKWLRVEYTDAKEGIIYKGFASAAYLKKL